MDEDVPGPPPTLVWCLSAFHTALLVAVLVAGLYLSGAAGDALSGLDTQVGVTVYLYLWAVTWWTNRRWLGAVEWEIAAGRPDPRAAGVEALRWGGVTGLVFFAGAFVVGAAALVAGGGVEAVPFAVLAGLIGAVLSFVVGALVGISFAGLDLVLLSASEIVLSDGGRNSPVDP